MITNMENFIEAPIALVKPDMADVKKDNGEVLFNDIRNDTKKFSWILSPEHKKLFTGMIQNTSHFRDVDQVKYKEFIDKTENFPVVWRKSELNELEKYTDKRFAKNVDKLFILNELVELEKLDSPPELRKIIEKHFEEGKMPEKSDIESLLKKQMTDEDYIIIERGLKLYDWKNIAYMMEHSKDIRYKAVADEKEFSKIEESIGKIEREYGRKLKFEEAKTELTLLSYPEYAEKLLSLKGQIGKLEEYYKIDEIEHIDEFENIDDIKDTGELKDILSDKFKKKMDKIKAFYYLDKFGSVKHLQNWLHLDKDKFEMITTEEFSKKVGNLGEQIGRSKGEVMQFFAGENFAHIDHSTVKALLDGKVVLSNDVREGKPDIFEVLGHFSNISNQEPTLWGRVRTTGLSNVTHLATLGRPDAGHDPYKGWEYVAAARNITRDDLKNQVNKVNLLDLAGGSDEEPGLEKAKERLDFVKENLPPSLKTRFNKVFDTLERWGEEGKKLEEENSNILLAAGAYVKIV